MYKYMSLTKRNCLVFLRDRSAVFFSLLSMLIVLMLMGIFLGKMNVESITALLGEFGGARDLLADKENAVHLVQYWTLAGILMVNSVTVTLTVTGVMVNDAGEGRLESFYTAPVSKNLIAFSYMTAAAFIGTLFCTITLTVGMTYIRAAGGALLPAKALVRIFLYILLNVSICSIVMYLIALFVKSSSAWSGLATIVGTLVGFAGAVYMPVGALPRGAATVLKYTPILHGTSLLRKICCSEMLEKTFSGISATVTAQYKENMGITVRLGDRAVSSSSQILFLGICGIVTLAAVLLLVKKKKVSDR